MKKRYFIISGLVLILFIFMFLILRVRVSKNEALNISYNYLNMKESDFSYKKVSKDLWENSYEVELNDGTYKYDIDINRTSGKVLSFEKEPIYKDELLSNNENYISVNEAKKIVLNHAKASESDAVFNIVNKELEDGIVIYDIEFIYKNKKYDYEIDAKTGNIIKYEIDKI